MTGQNENWKLSAQALVEMALAEDLDDNGDVTSRSLVAAGEQGKAVIFSREPCCLAGLDVACMAFEAIDERLVLDRCATDGDALEPGQPCLRIKGSVQSMLTAERTALNFLQRLSGIATQTSRMVKLVEGTKAVILDTRKTTPGWRLLEKHAVASGGGTNHRIGLFDRVMIKDNHRAFWNRHQSGGLAAAIERARQDWPDLLIEIEVESLAELEEVMPSKPEWVLLDNMSPADMAECVKFCDGRCKLEASGGITEENLAEVAASGIDAISLGCLTHSVRAVDLTMEMEMTAE
jgi:nicotinate-nucleotide pyrophosphorylase (carboxylating)